MLYSTVLYYTILHPATQRQAERVAAPSGGNSERLVRRGATRAASVVPVGRARHGRVRQGTTLWYDMIYCTILYYTVLYYTVLYYTVLDYTVLDYTVLDYTVLDYTIPY